jgi:glyoxylase-like metal-dependent hydrolase (beta-lactamase superfamily II)
VIQIEGLEIKVVSDGRFMADAGGPFGLVPRLLYNRYFVVDEANRIPMHLNCLLLRSEGKTILVDTGLGTRLSAEAKEQWGLERPDGPLSEALAEVGVGVEEVDIVLNTHLHADHCSGNTRLEGDHLTATFPNAEYWVQHMEWADASHPDARTRATYIADNFTPLWREGRLRLLNGDTPVTENVTCVVTPGHTRGHQSILLKAGSWNGLYVADLASYSVHMARSAWLTAYDVLPLENIKTKERWQQWALANDACLFFEHDPDVKTARLVEQDGRLKIEPVELESYATGSPPR